MTGPTLQLFTGRITAQPNPVPPEANSPVVVQWESNTPETKIHVSEDEAPEKLLAAGSSGSLSVDWVRAGRSYVFRLYGPAPERPLLDELLVLSEVAGKLSIESGDVANGDVGVRWEITAPAIAEVHLSADGSADRLVCRGMTGQFDVAGIKAGTEYTFRLYSADTQHQLLDEKTFFWPVAGKLWASPNPIPLEAGSRTTLRWETNSPDTAEICVSEGGGPETLVCRGRSGSYEVSRLSAGREYNFRLYALAGKRVLLDENRVSLSPIPWATLQERIQGARDGGEYSTGLSDFLGALLPRCVNHADYPKWFRTWEKSNVHVTPVHYYEPIPDSRTLDETIWSEFHPRPGLDLNEAVQKSLLQEVFPQFSEEYNKIPVEPTGDSNSFYLRNGRFAGLDPMLAYCMVRHFRPQQIVEVGSGFSTLVLAQAALVGGQTELHSIEPYPADFLTAGIPGLTSLLAQRVEEVDPRFFSRLTSGDFLFIDTSHVVRIGGDVNFLFLEILPQLQPGVIVHIHDIFLPHDYPKDWVVEKRRFWTEQYLLQAFLIYNSEFEVLVSSGYLSHYHHEEVRAIFPTAAPWGGGSFWIRRKDKI